LYRKGLLLILRGKTSAKQGSYAKGKVATEYGVARGRGNLNRGRKAKRKKKNSVRLGETEGHYGNTSRAPPKEKVKSLLKGTAGEKNSQATESTET